MAAHRVVRFLAQLHKEHGADALAALTTLDLGGGFGIAYRADETPLDVRAAGRGAARDRQARVPRRRPGRARDRGRARPGHRRAGHRHPLRGGHAQGRAARTAAHGRRYVSVDGGMSDNIRTALYDAVYDCRLVSRSSRASTAAVTPCCRRVVGKHCESGDIVVRDCWLPADLAPGDLLARRRHRRLLLLDGQLLQPAAAPRGGRRAGRRGPGAAAPGDRSRTSSGWRWTHDAPGRNRPAEPAGRSARSGPRRDARLRHGRRRGGAAAARAGRRAGRPRRRAASSWSGWPCAARTGTPSWASCSPPTRPRWSPATTWTSSSR